MGFVLWRDSLRRFDFQNDQVVDEQICLIFADGYAVIVDANGDFVLYVEAALAEFVNKSIDVYLLQKAIAERVVDVIKGIDNGIGEFTVLVGLVRMFHRNF